MANKKKENPNREQSSPTEKTEKPTFAQELASWAVTIGAAVLIALFLTQFIILNARVPSGSMENTIMTGDRLFGSRLTYLFHEPRRGDIIVFKYPVYELALKQLKGSEYKEFLKVNKKIRHTNYIKRLIGLPGETVDIVDGKIYINGSTEPLDEPYLKEEWRVYKDGHFEVPEGCYLMLGDNRNNSADARYWKKEAQLLFDAAGADLSEEDAEAVQFVTRKQILGKAYLRYWPITKISLLK